MIIVKENENIQEAIAECFKNAKSNSSQELKDFMYCFEKYSALIYFRIEHNKMFRSPRLKNSYHLGILFINNGKVLPFDQTKADEIIKLFFGKETEKLWECEPGDKSTLTGQMKHYNLFISVPYGYAAIYLQPEDMKELIKNKLVMFEGGEK